MNLLDGQYSFVVSVNTSNGVQFAAQYNWTVGMWYLSAARGHPTLFMLHNKSKENNGSFSLCKLVILECHALSVDTYIHELCVWSIGGCLGTS